MKTHTSDKVIAYLTLLSGLTISAVAVWYSVAGLVSIFAAAAIPIMIMGVALEVSKLIATVWLKLNWKRAPRLIKTYLIAAITVLMLITSMGIFGYLSKAHLDQAVPTGDVADKVAFIDEKIRTQRENIDAARRALKQMDEAVDQTMARSTSEQGADKASALRRSQQRERTALQNDIAKAQAAIAQLNEERAPIAKELRKVEAEVGPIKYIAALIYGDNPEANLLESAVRWVIIVIVLVFDPLAVVLLLASQYSFQWFREEKEIVEETTIDDLPNENKDEYLEPVDTGYVPGPWPFPVKSIPKEEPVEDNQIKEEIAEPTENKDIEEIAENNIEDSVEDDHIEIENAPETEKMAMKQWKLENPNGSLKHQRKLLERGIISELPWEQYLKPKADFTDEDAAIEAAKWAEEQLSQSQESKKKDNDVDGTGGESADKEIQGRLESYRQNEEQSEKTLWQRIQESKK